MKTRLLILTGIILAASCGFALAQPAPAAEPTVIKDGQVPANTVEVGNTVCPISGDKVPGSAGSNEMGEKPVKMLYKGKLYNLCCPMCIKDFKKDPEKYSAIAQKNADSTK